MLVGAVVALGCVYFVREREFSATRLERRLAVSAEPTIVLEDAPAETPAVDRAARPSALDAAGQPAVQSAAKRLRGPNVVLPDAGVTTVRGPSPAVMRVQEESQPRRRLGEPQRTLPARPTVRSKAASEGDEDAIWGERR
jgi:hypothetical protein